MSVLDGLAFKARLGVAVLIVAGFASILVVPPVIGAGAFLDGWGSWHDASRAQAQVQSRLASFEDRRRALMDEQAISEAELDLYLDGEATQARFNAAVIGLVEALRDQGLAVSGDASIQSANANSGLTQLSADISVDGPFEVILQTLSRPEFSSLRTQSARFTATPSRAEVRGDLRLVAYHADDRQSDGGPDAR